MNKTIRKNELIRIIKEKIDTVDNYITELASENRIDKPGAKDKFAGLSSRRFGILIQKWKECFSQLKTTEIDYALSPMDFIVEGARPINDYTGTAYNVAKNLNKFLKKYFIINPSVKIKIINCREKSNGAYRVSIKIDNKFEIDYAKDLKKKFPDWFELIFPTQINPPLKSGLKLLKISHDEDKGMFFRPEGPLFIDFENKFVVENGTKRDEIINNLESRKAVLLISDKPASGKSVLVRSILYKKVIESVHTQYFFASPQYRDINSYELFRRAIDNYNSEVEHGLLIIEDAHLNPELVNYILAYTDEFQHLEIILTSRKIEEFSITGENNFNSIKLVTVEPTDELIYEIIKKYLKKKLPHLENKSKEVKDVIDEIFKKKLFTDKVNLWLLSYAFRAMKDNELYIDEQKILSYIAKDLKKIGSFFKHTNTRALSEQLLITLSVLYRFEIPTDVSFLEAYYHKKGHKITDISSTLDSLYEIKEVTKNGNLYGLHHSAIAELYFSLSIDESGEWPGSKIYGNEVNYIKLYLFSDKASNGRNLVTFAKLKTFEKTLKLSLLAMFPSVNNKTLKIGHYSDISPPLSIINEYLSFLNIMSPQKAKEFCQITTKEKIIQLINDEAPESQVFLHLLNTIALATSNEWVEEIISGIDKNIILNFIFHKTDYLQNHRHCIKNNSNLESKYDKEKSTTKSKKINITLAFEYLFVSLTIFDRFPNAGKIFWEKSDERKIAKKLRKIKRLSRLSHTFSHIYKFSPKAAFNILNEFGYDEILYRIHSERDNEYRRNVQSDKDMFIQTINKIDPSFNFRV